MEKLTSKTVTTVKTTVPVKVHEARRFSETIAIDHKEKMKAMAVQFKIQEPKPKKEKTEFFVKQTSAPQGLKMEVEVPRTKVSSTMIAAKSLTATATPTKRQQLQIEVEEKRRFSETVAIDHKRMKPVELVIPKPKIVEKSSLVVQQKPALKGVKMEIEVPELFRQTSTAQYIKHKQVQAIETKRQEFIMHLSGNPPRFIIELESRKVMDGEEVKFKARVRGTPTPDVAWYHNGKKIVDNPDFRTSYNRDSGECELLILEVFPQDTGTYECIAINKYGRATTKAHLVVEVYEYVPDSEEATASQTESVISTSSMDETEFVKKTQKFLQKMEEIRKEMHDEEITSTYEEEIVEEMEIEEQGFEETILMADVKWQIPKYVEPRQERVSPEKTEELQQQVNLDQMKQAEIEGQTFKAIVTPRRLSHVKAMEGPTGETASEDIVASGASFTEQKETHVELAHHTVAAQKPSRVEPVTETFAPEAHEEMTGVVLQDTKGMDCTVDLAKPVVTPQRPSHTLPVAEAPMAESAENLIGEASEAMQEDEYTVELAQPSVEAKKPTLVQMTMEQHPEELTEDVTTVPSEQTKEEEIAMELTQPSVQAKKPTLVQMTMEQHPEELTEDVTSVPSEQTKEQEITMELTQPAVEGKQESQVGQQLEHMAEEMAEEGIIHELTAQTTPGEDIQLEMAEHQVRHPEGTMAATQVARLTEENITEMLERMPSPDMTESQEVLMEYGQHQRQPKTATMAPEQEEKLSEGSVDENIHEIPAVTMEGQEVSVELATPSAPTKEVSMVGMVEETHSEEEEEEIFYEVPEPSVPGEDVIVELSVSETKDRAQTLAAQQMAKADIEMAEEANADFTEEMTQEEEIQSIMTTAEKEAPKPSMVHIQETVAEPLQTKELVTEDATEDVSQESKVEVPMDTAASAAPKPSLVGTQEEKMKLQETKEDISEFVEDVTVPDEVKADFIAAETEGRPETRVSEVAEAVPPEKIAEEVIGSIKEVYMIPTEVRPEYEPSVVERYRLEARVKAQEGVRNLEMAEMSQVDFQAVSAQQSQMTVDMSQAETSQAAVRAVQEVTQETEVVTEMAQEQIEFIQKYATETVTVAEKGKEYMAPVFEIPLSDVTVTDGEMAVLECRVAGVPQPTVTWFVSGQEIKPSVDFKITYEEGLCTLVIYDVLPEDEGEYAVKAVNEAGTCVTTAYLTVLRKHPII